MEKHSRRQAYKRYWINLVNSLSMHLSRSTIMVLKELATAGPMTPKQLSKELNIAPRTVTYALQRLLKWKLCHRLPNLEDMRQPIYVVNPEAQVLLRIYGMDTVIREPGPGLGMQR